MTSPRQLDPWTATSDWLRPTIGLLPTSTPPRHGEVAALVRSVFLREDDPVGPVSRARELHLGAVLPTFLGELVVDRRVLILVVDLIAAVADADRARG